MDAPPTSSHSFEDYELLRFPIWELWDSLRPLSNDPEDPASFCQALGPVSPNTTLVDQDGLGAMEARK
jgi:hypothetical protein